MPVDSGGGGHPEPMQDAGRTAQPLDKYLHRAEQRRRRPCKCRCPPIRVNLKGLPIGAMRELGNSRSRLPPEGLPVLENGCIIGPLTTVVPLDAPPPPKGPMSEFRAWLAEFSVRLKDVVFDDLSTYLSAAIHGTNIYGRHLCVSCLKSFPSAGELEKHFWGDLAHLGLSMIRPLYLQTTEEQIKTFTCPFCRGFRTTVKCRILLHQTLSHGCREWAWALTMAHKTRPTMNLPLSSKLIPEAPETLRYNPQLSDVEITPVELSHEEGQRLLSFIMMGGSGSHPAEPKPLTANDPISVQEQIPATNPTQQHLNNRRCAHRPPPLLQAPFTRRYSVQTASPQTRTSTRSTWLP
ncbi:Hypothetical protein GLP15_2463 [Giardia lamblia P15]|uniref:Uncharacterized protein n=1 Tax=Giardia intestinalis (strain P15) TaxID=658858 RepID=E1F6R0_GIAIA|nr:Hypothetical protein GLP15_2463 [Giardia lamblia P15]